MHGVRDDVRPQVQPQVAHEPGSPHGRRSGSGGYGSCCSDEVSSSYSSLLKKGVKDAEIIIPYKETACLLVPYYGVIMISHTADYSRVNLAAVGHILRFV